MPEILTLDPRQVVLAIVLATMTTALIRSFGRRSKMLYGVYVFEDNNRGYLTEDYNITRDPREAEQFNTFSQADIRIIQLGYIHNDSYQPGTAYVCELDINTLLGA